MKGCMDFKERLRRTETVINVLKAGLWENPIISRRLLHIDYGSEHYVPRDVHEMIRYLYTPTTRHIKYALDFFVIDRQNPDRTNLLEYKCTQTPLHSRGRIA